MVRSFDSVSNVKLPRWVAITASAVGILMLAVGMSRILRFATLRSALPPMLIGLVVAYASGFEKRSGMDDEGVYEMKSFWGRKKETRIAWERIADTRVILNRGKYIYVLLHGADKIPPFTLRRSEAECVIALLQEKLSDGKVIIEA